MNSVKFEIYQSPFDQSAFGFEPHADYARVWEGELELSGPLDLEQAETSEVTPILERIFHDFQRVDPETGPWPPEGYTGRSLSVGDVVLVDGWAPFAVEPLGFAVAFGFSASSEQAREEVGDEITRRITKRG